VHGKWHIVLISLASNPSAVEASNSEALLPTGRAIKATVQLIDHAKCIGSTWCPLLVPQPVKKLRQPMRGISPDGVGSTC